MKKDYYKGTSKFVLRTPLLPLNFFYDLTSSEECISDAKFKELFNNKIIIEAIFLASPSLYYQYEKFVRNEISDVEKKERLKNSILKYLSRMSSRCTPYGLFAGCSIGEFSEKTNILLHDLQKYERHTRLDMNYMVALSDQISKDQNIKYFLKFYPNSTIYKVNNKYRYVEYYYKNGNRYHDIIAVDSSEYLEKILEYLRVKDGTYLDEIINLIVDDDIDYEMAENFIEELVDAQILVNELEPSVSGPEFFHQILSVLEEKRVLSPYVDFLKNIENRLNDIDLTIGNKIEKYLNIKDSIERENVEYNLKYLFQCDLIIANIENTLNKNVIKDIEKAILLLHKIKKTRPKSSLDYFKDEFYERYEGHEMPISKILDPEIGIGYGRSTQSDDDNPLIDDLFIPAIVDLKMSRDIKWSVVDDIIQKKILKSLKEKQSIVKIQDEDFSFLPDVLLDDLPETISFLIEMVKCKDGNYKIKFNGGGGGSGANLLARFCHGDKAMNDFVQEIVQFEKGETNEIVAEIVHLPEARVGNILARPDFRDFEIPYLARSTKSSDNKIYMDDIMVAIRNNKISLRSKAYNKEIIPKLTNSHNFSNNNALPVYHFLCDLQTNNNSPGVYFDISAFQNLYKFIPRIEYRNIILSYATWNLDSEDYKLLVDAKKDEEIAKEIENIRREYDIPEHFILTDGDNDLLINAKNMSCVKMFKETIKNRPAIRLNEFIFADLDHTFIKDSSGNNFTNEIIVTLFKGNE